MISAAVDMAVRASLLLGMTWAIAKHLEQSGSSAANRHAVWLSGFGSLALLPLCISMMPAIPLRVLTPEPIGTGGREFLAAQTGPVPQGAASIDFLTVATVTYVIGLALLLGRIITGQLVLKRLWRRARPFPSGSAALKMAVVLGGALGIRRSVEIRLLEGVVPMTWGSLRPRLLLPAAAIGWPDDRLRSVLLHEFGHVSRNDSLARVAVEAICAFYWPHPAVWVSARRMRLAQEQASDDLALNHGAPALTYARHLLASAKTTVGPASALAMASSPDLGLRLQAIVADGKRGSVSWRFVTLAIVLSVGVAASVSAVVLAPMPAKPGAVNAPKQLMQPTAVISPAALDADSSPTGTSAPHPVGAPPTQQATQTRTRRPEAHDTISLDPAARDEDYAIKLARYGEDVRRYDAALHRYGEELNNYSHANADFIRNVRAYQNRMAAIGPDPPPGTLIPTYPTAPVAPTYPTAPTMPVKPVLRPALHHTQ